MNDTPRTDAALLAIEDNCKADGLKDFPAYTHELVNLARDLERELQIARRCPQCGTKFKTAILSERDE